MLNNCMSDLTDRSNSTGVQLATELLARAAQYAEYLSAEGQLILQSFQYFNMMMNTYRIFESIHRQKLLLSTSQLPINDTFNLQAVARMHLEAILSKLQGYLFARKKEHWLSTFYCLCIVLLAVEVTQMILAFDDLLSGHRGLQWASTSHTMEKCVTDTLIPLFKMSTRGFSPLSIDMDKESSVSSLEHDGFTVEEYKRLQKTMTGYGKDDIERLVCVLEVTLNRPAGRATEWYSTSHHG
ncbi:MAG: hypothetical protein M1836_007210 [Candelina mexicana]|nr:MAG: hypothetical protein M1836_007210 [Candelina mexicana]